MVINDMTKKKNRREIKIKAKTKAFDFHAVFKIID